MACVLAKAVLRDTISFRSAWMRIAPRAERAVARGEEVVRVMQRTCQLERERKVRATDEPWVPVAPIMVMVFCGEVDMVVVGAGMVREFDVGSLGMSGLEGRREDLYPFNDPALELFVNSGSDDVCGEKVQFFVRFIAYQSHFPRT